MNTHQKLERNHRRLKSLIGSEPPFGLKVIKDCWVIKCCECGKKKALLRKRLSRAYVEAVFLHYGWTIYERLNVAVCEECILTDSH